MPNPIRVLTVDAAGTLIKPWPSVGAVYAKTARKYGIEINDNKYTTETLVTHKSLKFKETIKRTNLIEE